MSRSWERKVRRNSAQLNQKLKKSGIDPMAAKGPSASSSLTMRFKGRNFISPILLLLFVGAYAMLMPMQEQEGSSEAMNWFVVAAYAFLALMFFLRRPYLQVGPDHVQTRRMLGDKRLGKDEIKGITVQKGYVIIQPAKGGNWVFSRVMNRYPVERMGERLEKLAAAHGIPFQKS
ncbi:hypothetical protein HGI30_10945 [Paenibacillus albicereus]|uniref:Methyltransferase n=1 Tax=Paenibacillus albicereus TaxID=2726185 RepID=A0A6H2GXW5_9BACL|nr:hypothetical protein [Paenibacillus albicereus]QJC52016.1 hypothetical protein HGI30_10945 [Paenibacillus albicereus]